MKGPLYDIERDELVKEVTEACRNLLKLGTADFKEHRAVALVAFASRLPAVSEPPVCLQPRRLRKTRQLRTEA